MTVIINYGQEKTEQFIYVVNMLRKWEERHAALFDVDENKTEFDSSENISSYPTQLWCGQFTRQARPYTKFVSNTMYEISLSCIWVYTNFIQNRRNIPRFSSLRVVYCTLACISPVYGRSLKIKALPVYKYTTQSHKSVQKRQMGAFPGLL